MKETEKLPTIDLVGSALENFYQLGLKDREQAQISLKHINSLANTDISPLDKSIKKVLSEVSTLLFANGNNFERYIEAYSKGLGVSKKDLCHSLLIPELMGSMNKWLPSIPTGIMGCSSVFYKHADDKISHTRLLDYPLGKSYENSERIIRYKLDEDFSLLSFSSAGMCFPSLTTVREDGLTMAIHQKFSDIFNTSGTPIFYLIFKLLKTCETKEEIINFCHTHQSITSWNLNISLSNGEILEIDFLGDKVKISEYELEREEHLILNNVLPEEISTDQFKPWGINSYNELRYKSLTKKLKAFSKLKNKGPKEILKAITTIDFKGTYLDAVTTSCLVATTLSPKSDQIFFINSKAPKSFQGSITEISNLFEKNLKQTELTFKRPNYPRHATRGYTSLMNTQSAIDQSNYHEAYHQLQMAIDDLKGLPLYHVSRFYFLVLQFINDRHHKIRKELLVEFINILEELPPYLKEHCKLFIFRLEKILSLEISISESDFQNQNFKSLYKAEKELPKLFFHSFISKMMNIRIDLMDIIYPYAPLIMIKS